MIEFFAGLFALGLGGWAIVIVVSVAIICAIEWERNAVGFGAIAVAAGLVWLLGGMNIPSITGVIHWIDVNWVKVVFFLAAYFGAGAGWALIKYFVWIWHDQTDNFKARESGLREEWKRHYTADFPTFRPFFEKRFKEATHPLANKERITRWMMWWPWSAFWTILGDGLKHAWRAIRESLTNIMVRMQNFSFNRRFGDIQ